MLCARTIAYGLLLPVLVNAMLTFIALPAMAFYWGLVIATALGGVAALQTLNVHRFYFRSVRFGINIRSAVICLLYDRSAWILP